MLRLDHGFYGRNAEVVARELLGKVFVRREADGVLAGMIVETEAYCGQSDPGSHAYRGRTARTDVMFGPPGFLYVYFIYGAHYCTNVVTDSDGTAGAVLLRALEPVRGIEIMRARRKRESTVELCNGPGKLCQAFGIDRSCNGASLLTGSFSIEDDGKPAGVVATTTRVGLSSGRELALRFFLDGNPFVSRGKPSL